MAKDASTSPYPIFKITFDKKSKVSQKFSNLWLFAVSLFEISWNEWKTLNTSITKPKRD